MLTGLRLRLSRNDLHCILNRRLSAIFAATTSATTTTPQAHLGTAPSLATTGRFAGVSVASEAPWQLDI